MNHAQRKRISVMYVVWGFVLCLAILSVTSCQPKNPNEENRKLPLTKVRVGYIPIAECVHLYVGISKKFFEQEGLEIDLQPMKGGALILPAVQQGDLDIGFANVVSLIIINSRLPHRSLLSFISLAGASYERPGNCNHALLVKRNSTISVSDLSNPEVTIALNTTRNIEELMLRRFMDQRGLSERRLNLVTMGFPDMLSALRRGDVKVAAVVEPFIEPAIHSGEFSLIVNQYLEVSSNTVVATYGVTRNWFKSNQDIANRFVRAFSKADTFIRENDPETRQIIGSFTMITKEDLPIIGMPAFEKKISKESIVELIQEMRRFEFITSDSDPNDLLVPDGDI